MNWKWNAEEKTVEMNPGDGPLVLSWRSPSLSEINAFDYEVEKARRVYITLEKAKGCFEGGRASYENATEEVKHLIDESNKSALELVDTLGGIDRWFEKPVAICFKNNADRLLAFVKEWIARQGPPEGVVGNSSRGPSETSRTVPPTTAVTARGSSSDPEASPRASGSGRTNGSRRKIARDARTS